MKEQTNVNKDEDYIKNAQAAQQIKNQERELQLKKKKQLVNKMFALSVNSYFRMKLSKKQRLNIKTKSSRNYYLRKRLMYYPISIIILTFT